MKEKSFDILEISTRAKLRSAENFKTYDGTAGMLFDEQGKLYSFSSVRAAMKALSTTAELSYSPSLGSPANRQVIADYIFSRLGYQPHKKYRVFDSLGGTGALAMIASYLPTENYILPDLMWPNYLNIFKVSPGAPRYRTCDISSLCAALDSANLAEGEVAVVINDPAQNPTGYSLDEDGYQSLVTTLNLWADSSRKIDLILDLAYSDYGPDQSRPYRYLDQLDDRISIFVCFSGSKTFGIYGLRTGALLASGGDADKLEQHLSRYARSNYSCPPCLGFEMMKMVMSNKKLYHTFIRELEKSRQLLQIRAEVFKAGLDQQKISYEPYCDGFYLTLNHIADAPRLLLALEAKDVFLVPIDESHIRVALCSLTIDQLKTLPTILGGAIDEDQE